MFDGEATHLAPTLLESLPNLQSVPISPQEFFLLTARSACPLTLHPLWQAALSLYRSLLAQGGPGVPCPGALSVGHHGECFHYAPLFVPSIILLGCHLGPSPSCLGSDAMEPSRQIWLLSIKKGPLVVSPLLLDF